MKNLLIRWLFPPKCAGCGAFTDWYAESCALCQQCHTAWQKEKTEHCGICGRAVKECTCLTEKMQKAKCEAFYKLAFYANGQRTRLQNRMIYRIKESRNQHLYAFLARELWETVQKEITDPASCCIVYLPRTKRAKLHYGVDQAATLARALSRLTGIAMEACIVRQGGTVQKDLSAAARLRNAKASFAIKNGTDLHGVTVLLVDDVVTTGAGMAVCTRLLRKAGAERVIALAVASDDVNRERT